MSIEMRGSQAVAVMSTLIWDVMACNLLGDFRQQATKCACLSYSFTLKLEARRFFEKSLNYRQCKRRHILHDSALKNISCSK
jgi:hypothetical protein